MGFEIAVIIPAYNVAETIEAQLEGLRVALEGAPSTEIVVVDNRSVDGSAHVIEVWSKRTGTPVRVVTADGKAGEPYARNVGIAASDAPYVLFCDGDDIVRPNWIREMHTALGSSGYVTGPVRTDVLNEPWLANVRGSTVFDGRPMLHNVVPFAHGASMGFRRGLLDELGGFDESFLAGCDQEIGVRAWRAGHTLTFAPEAIIDYRLRPDLASTWRQGRSYGRYRIRVRSLIAEHLDQAGLRRANVRRIGWLVKHLPPVAWDRTTRARWVWVAAQLVGEAHGGLEQRRAR